MYVQNVPRTGVAVAALVLMLLAATGAWCMFSLLPAALAIVCGHYALHEVKTAAGPLRGRHMAIWSLILAYPIAAIWGAAFIYTVAQRVGSS